MKNNIDSLMKEYFQEEISSMAVPAIPDGHKTRRLKFENLFLAAFAAACLLLITQPGQFSSRQRSNVISKSVYEMRKDNFTRVIFDAAQEYKNNKGINYD